MVNILFLLQLNDDGDGGCDGSGNGGGRVTFSSLRLLPFHSHYLPFETKLCAVQPSHLLNNEVFLPNTLEWK